PSRSLQLPPMSGDPPRPSNRPSALTVSQAVSVPLVPAFAMSVIATVTVADAFGQGALPPTLYVYTPSGSVAGSNVPLCGPVGPVHVPPGLGMPPRLPINCAGWLLVQMSNVPSSPGSGGATFVMSTVAESRQRLPSITT